MVKFILGLIIGLLGIIAIEALGVWFLFIRKK